MTGLPNTPTTTGDGRLDRFAAARPDMVLMVPFLAYLALLGVRDQLPYDYRWVAAVLRGVGALWVFWLFRKHMPAWGKPHVLLALVCGVLIAAGWYYGQYLFNGLGVPQRIPLPLFPGDAEAVDPRAVLADEGGFWVGLLGVNAVFWMDVVTRIAVASTTVAIVEEFFWRAFLLRALIDWSSFEKVPLGRFTWFSFLFSSLLSTLEHPDNWAVSIPCWFAFNALMYWKKSVLFLVLTHGFTNLFLYIWVILNALCRGDASAWMFW